MQPVSESAEASALTTQTEDLKVAEAVTLEVRIATAQAVLSEGAVEISEVLKDRQDETLALVERLLASAGLSAKFSLPDVEAAVEPKNGIKVELTDTTNELSPEVLDACLRNLEKDFQRGIVVLDERKTVDEYRAALAADKTAGTTWDVVRARLEANGGALLKKAARMQGGGTLIGVYTNGELCMKDRGNEPVIFGITADGRKVTITTDTPNRDAVMQSVRDDGQFANYWEIRAAVAAGGYTLPPDSTDYRKKGIVAAAEAVTDECFVQSKDDKEWRSAILECGDVSKSAGVRVVNFNPDRGNASVSNGNPGNRRDNRGAVRVLRG